MIDPHFETLAKGFYARHGITSEISDVAEIEVELGSRLMRIHPSASLRGRVICRVELSDPEEIAAFSSADALRRALMFNAECLMAEDFRFVLAADGAPSIVASFAEGALSAETLMDSVKEGFAAADILLGIVAAADAEASRPVQPFPGDLTILR